MSLCASPWKDETLGGVFVPGKTAANLASGAVLFLVIIILLCSCAGLSKMGQAQTDELTIVTTYTILEDFVRNVVGEDAEVRNITPVGAEVHEWELVPRNFADLEQADVVFYNGLNLEQWMDQVDASVRADVPVVSLGESCGYPTLPIATGSLAGEPDPHIWMHPEGAAAYLERICTVLSEINPSRASYYRDNTDRYLQQLQVLHEELATAFSHIPVEHRLLVTTEAAFIYFANAYGFAHDGIWGTNTEEEGTPQQMLRIMKIVENQRPRAVFWESTGSSRYALSVSDDTGIPIAGPLYVDSFDEAGTSVETYLDMMRANANLIVSALTGD